MQQITWQNIPNGAAAKTGVAEYRIIWNAFEKEYQCFYADGKFKPFKTVAEAQEWVETVHYPEKVNEILKKLGVVK